MIRLILIVVCLLAFAVPSAQAQRAEGIAAVVNDDIITSTDLKNRAEMILKSSGRPASKDMVLKIQPQALEGLISEAIQLQEARRKGIAVSEADVAGGVKQIAQNNNMEEEQFRAIIARQGVRMSSIEHQIKAQIGWGKVIQQVLRPRITVNESEIEAERTKMAATAGKREFLVAEIFLPVSKSADDAKVRALAATLAAQIKKGAQFPAIARQHSQSASAAQGGMIGWVREGQLEPALDSAIARLTKDEMSAPVKGEDGYYILYLRDSRTAEAATGGETMLSLREIAMNTSGMTEAAAKAKAEALVRELTGCIDIAKRAAADKGLNMSERKVALSELTEDEKARLGKFDIGRASAPQYTHGRAVITMVCERTDPGNAASTDQALERKIGLQRLDMLQKRYLRDLISAAYIERRV